MRSWSRWKKYIIALGLSSDSKKLLCFSISTFFSHWNLSISSFPWKKKKGEIQISVESVNGILEIATRADFCILSKC